MSSAPYGETKMAAFALLWTAVLLSIMHRVSGQDATLTITPQTLQLSGNSSTGPVTLRCNLGSSLPAGGKLDYLGIRRTPLGSSTPTEQTTVLAYALLHRDGGTPKPGPSSLIRNPQLAGGISQGYLQLTMPKATCGDDEATYICETLYSLSSETGAQQNLREDRKNFSVEVSAGSVTITAHPFLSVYQVNTKLTLNCSGQIGNAEQGVQITWVWQYKSVTDPSMNFVDYIRTEDIVDGTINQDLDNTCQRWQTSTLTRTLTLEDSGREYRCFVRRNNYLSEPDAQNVASYTIKNVVSAQKADVGPIIGGVIGGLVVIIIVVVLVYFLVIRKRRQKADAYRGNNSRVSDETRLSPESASYPLLSADDGPLSVQDAKHDGAQNETQVNGAGGLLTEWRGNLKTLPLEEVLTRVKQIVSELEKLEEYHTGEGMRYQKMLDNFYRDYTSHRADIGDCLSDCGYAPLTVKMMKTVNSMDIFKNDDIWFLAYYTYVTAMNYSHASEKLAKSMAEADAVRLMTLNLGRKPHLDAMQSKIVYFVLKTSLCILCNIAKRPDVQHYFKDNKTAEVIIPFITMKDEVLKAVAMLTLANIVEEENSKLIDDTETIAQIVKWTAKAVESGGNQRFQGFAPWELVEGLDKLAVNDANKMKVIEAGALPVFLKMLQHDDPKEQATTATCLRTLAFDKTVREKIIEFEGLMPALEALTYSHHPQVKKAATGALWVIKGENDPNSSSTPGINPLTATPRRTFSMGNQQLRVPGDKKRPRITCLAVTGGGRVVMADNNNQSVKVLDAGSPASISALSLGAEPCSLAVCHDGLVAVTSLSDNVIRLIDVTDAPRVVQQIKTVRQYWGVGCGGVDDALLVSCEKDKDGPAQLDVITREGTVVRTVVDSSSLSGLEWPDYLCVVGGQVLLSDWCADCVWRVDVATGSLLAEHTHQELKCPRQVTADRAGNMYVASWNGDCVLVMGRDGQWRTLLRGNWLYDSPCCVALTSTRLFVGWSVGGQSVLLGYELA